MKLVIYVISPEDKPTQALFDEIQTHIDSGSVCVLCRGWAAAIETIEGYINQQRG